MRLPLHGLIIFLSLNILIINSCRKDTVKSSLPDPLEAGWKGHKTCELLMENDEMRVLRCYFKPGEGHEKHFHAPHLMYALAGSKFKLTDTTGVREAEMNTGEFYYSEGTPWHITENIGDSISAFLIVEPK